MLYNRLRDAGNKELIVSKSGKWEDKTVDVSELKLDLQNPRLPKYVKDVQDENHIRDYLLNKENIAKIARSISANGYHHSAISIAYEDPKDGKYIVLDGNRRLAASQLLSSPALAADAKTRKEFERYAEDMPAESLSQIKVTVAPSRKAAEKEIWDIHVTPTSKPWEVLQKLRMYRNLIETGDYDISTASHEYGMSETKFKNELAKLFLYEQILERTDEDGQEELINSGFNKIQRILMSANGRKLLDFSIENNGKIVINDVGTFDKNLTNLTPYIVEPNRVSAQVTQEDLVDNVYSKIDPKIFTPSSDKQSAKTPSSPVKQTVAKTQTASSKGSGGTGIKSDWITDAEFRLYSGADRVKDILGELKKNKPTKGQNLNITSIALRVAVELAIYDVLKQKGHIQKIIKLEKERIKTENTKRATSGKAILSSVQKDWTPTLNQMLDYMLNEANRLISDPQERRALARLRTQKKEYLADLNSFMHNVSFKPTESSTREIWDTFGRQIFDIIKKM